MKLAISGKGGVGKSTIAAGLALLLAERGSRVLALDADPDANLASALGLSPKLREAIVPLAKHRELIEERTGAKLRQYGQIFKLNPEVSDIVPGYAVEHRGVALLVVGAIERGGSGCACPEGVLIRALVADLVLHRNDALIMDMEAGLEHLGRSTVSGVDTMLVVVEPGQKAIDSALRIEAMCSDIGLRRIAFVANRVTSKEDERFVADRLAPRTVLGSLPASEAVRLSDREGRSVMDEAEPAFRKSMENLLESLTKLRATA
jgi:CO dehydrogenase maturation factor